MATFVADVPLNLTWRGVAIKAPPTSARDGRALQPGELAYVPDSLAYHFDREMRGRIPGFRWTETPPADVLEEQRAAFEAREPHIPWPTFGDSL